VLWRGSLVVVLDGELGDVVDELRGLQVEVLLHRIGEKIIPLGVGVLLLLFLLDLLLDVELRKQLGRTGSWGLFDDGLPLFCHEAVPLADEGDLAHSFAASDPRGDD
jgi:hypothetical protein